MIEIKHRRLIYFSAIIIVMALAAVIKLWDTTPQYVKEYLGEGEAARRVRALEDDKVKELYIITDRKREPVQMLQFVETVGYNGLIRLQVKLDIQKQKLVDLKILSHQETDNYGGYAAEDWFMARFLEKSTATDLNLVKVMAQSKDEIVAVTGATITSQAIVDGVNAAFNAFRNYKEGIK
ncbi:MAG: FMN-binding protein [Firmicutes bacterium]|nr:FMN-binding protein [Bacillota bacterium]